MSASLEPARRLLARLAPPGSRVVVATSGGPDSQALLALVAREREALGLGDVWALGVDHGLRPEAPVELELAAELAARLGVPFRTRKVDVEKTGNLMAAARKARYAALEGFADEVGADRIAVAHTASDQIESVLLNLARGAGLRGAGGIRQKRGRVIRPLLRTSRDEILAFLEGEQIPFATDPTNRDLRRARAMIRHQVVPLLRKLNPGLELAFGRFSDAGQHDDDLLSRLAGRDLAERLGPLDSLDISGFSAKPVPLAFRVLKAWLKLHGLSADRDTLVRLFAVASGRATSIAFQGATIRAERHRLWVAAATAFDLELPVPGRVEVPDLGVAIVTELRETAVTPYSDAQKIALSEVAFTPECPHLALRVRSWQRGDRLQPFGMDGHVKVGDLFTNAKIPRALRGIWPIVVHGEEILWVVGLRRSAGSPVDAAAREVVVVRVDGALPWQPC